MDTDAVAGSAMNAENNRGLFRATFDGWPYFKGTGHEVHTASQTVFAADDPSLWKPLLSSSARRDAFSRHANSCINCMPKVTTRMTVP